MEYPLHLGHLEIHIALSNPGFSLRILVAGERCCVTREYFERGSMSEYKIVILYGMFAGESCVVNGELSNLQCIINTPQIPTSMSESSLRVIVLPSFVLPYFKLGIEQDEILKALLIKQEAEWVEWFCPCLLIPIFWSNSHRGHLVN